MLIEVLLVASDTDADTVSVATQVEIDLADPRWSRGLVDAVAGRAEEGARHLRDALAAARPEPACEPGAECGSGREPGAGLGLGGFGGFVPLATLVEAVEPETPSR
jgi:hypothetical protein